MSKTNIGLVKYVKAQVGKPYWYGCFGQMSTRTLYASKKRQYPSQYEWSCPSNQLNKRVHDCIGLIKGYLWSTTATSTPKYNASQDVSADGMLKKCRKKGTIGSIPDVEGVLVFMKGHVGVYIGNGEVVEARGHAYGVVKTKLKNRGWTHWGYCPYITYKTNKKYQNGAKKFDSKYKNGKTYRVNTKLGLNIRNGAGTSNKSLGVLPNGTEVTWYGYYTTVDGVDWKHVIVKSGKYKNTTGFVSSKYLK